MNDIQLSPISIEDIEACSSRPVYVARAGHSESSDHAGPQVPVNEGPPVPVESPIFKGHVKIYLKGLDNSPPDLFQGQKRRSLMIVQGRFTQPNITFNDVVTGQEFARVQHLPPRWVVNQILRRIAHFVSPSLEIGKDLSAPYALMPVISGAQGVHIALPDDPLPDMMSHDNVMEDMRLTDPELICRDGHGPAPSGNRQRHFSHAKAREDRVFDTRYVYTFYFVQHVVDLSTYHLHMFRSWNLLRYIDGQPLQFMLKNRNSGEYLFRFLAWHPGLLPSKQ